MKKKKVVLDQFDFIRAIACFGIVLYHFAVEYGWPDIFNEYYGAAEPPVRCGESHLSGLTEPPHFVY